MGDKTCLSELPFETTKLPYSPESYPDHNVSTGRQTIGDAPSNLPAGTDTAWCYVGRSITKVLRTYGWLR